MKKKFAICMILILSIYTLAGCQSASLKAPKLKEGQTGSHKTYTVKKEDLFEIVTKDVYVSGVRECAVAKNTGVIKSIHKRLGDTVKKGEVIATIEADEIQSEYDSLRESIGSEQAQHSMQMNVYRFQKEQKNAVLSHMQQLYEESKTSSKKEKTKSSDKVKEKEKKDGDTSASQIQQEIALCKAQIQEIDHRISYETQRYQIAISEDQQKLADLKNKLQECSIISPCNGEIGCFVGDIGVGSTVEENMPVIVVYNADKKVLVTDDEEMEDVESLNSTYVRIKNKEYEVKKYKYTAKERKNLTKAELGIYTCYEFEGIQKEKLSTPGVLVIKGNEKKQVLAVPNAAIKMELEKKYVYAQRQGNYKKVEIQTGISNSTYTEITEGLQEGEVITYTHYDNIMREIQALSDPEIAAEQNCEIQECTISNGDVYREYDIEGEEANLLSYESCKVVDDQEGAIFQKIVVKDGDVVKKGDVIAYVDHGVKNSEKIAVANTVAQANKSIASENQSYQQQLKEYQKQLQKETSAYDRKQLQYDINILKVQHETTLKELNLTASQARKEQLELNEKASGVIYAPISGEVGQLCDLKKGEVIGSGQELCTITNLDTVYIEVPYYILHQGMKLNIRSEDKKEYTGTVVYSSSDILKKKTEEDEDFVNYIRLDNMKTADLKIQNLKYRALQVSDVPTLPGEAYQMRVSYDSFVNDENSVYKDSTQIGYYVYLKQADKTLSKKEILAHPGTTIWVISGLSDKDTVTYLHDITDSEDGEDMDISSGEQDIAIEQTQ